MQLSVREIVKEGSASLFIGCLRNLHDEQKLARATSLSQFVSLFASPLPMVVANARGVILEFNEAATLMLDYQRGEVVGHELGMLMTPEEAKFHGQFLSNYMQTNIKSAINRTIERIAVRKGGFHVPARRHGERGHSRWSRSRRGSVHWHA